MRNNLINLMLGLFVATMFSMAGCGDGSGTTTQSLSESNTPSTSSKQVALAVSELANFGASMNSVQHPLWVYYTDKSNNRWYISQVSQVASGSKTAVYSLGPISASGAASWWTVGYNSAIVDTVNNNVIVDSNLDAGSSSTFYDAGLQTNITNSGIHSDRQMIQGTTVSVKWYFFKAQNGSWYIVNAPGYGGTSTYVRRFSSNNGQYDWPDVDMTGRNAFFSFSAVAFVPFDKFIADRNGNSIDMDGKYGAQCVDLMHAYLNTALGLTYPDVFTGNAYPIYNAAASATTKYSNLFAANVKFTKIANTPTGVPVKGDIIFWKPVKTGDPGHVAIFISGDQNNFTSLDQNWVNSSDNGSPAAIVSHGYTGPTSAGLSGVAGWLHPSFE